MKQPNFFIAGASKSGTTAMSYYLREHPHIFMPQRKEPHYFADDLPGLRKVHTLDAYLALFRPSSEQQSAVGEASACYLYSTVALHNIYRFNPQAKIILMLRNPIDLIAAFHAELLYNLFEDQPDLEVAWNLQSARREGRSIPPHSPEPRLLQYAQFAQFGAQVERLLHIFPPEQVHITLFDDFVAAPDVCYRQILDFLHITLQDRMHFPRINERKTHRIRWVGEFLMHWKPAFLVKPWQQFKQLLGIEQLCLRKTIVSWNTRKNKQPGLSPHFRAQLVNTFRADIDLLASILRRDLSHWYTAASHVQSTMQPVPST